MTIYSQIQSNKIRSVFIVVFFVAFISMVGFLLGEARGNGFSWLIMAFIISLFSSLGSYYWGDKIVLSMNNAKPADRRRDFDFYSAAENISIASGLPLPKLYVIESPAMNAFATGRNPDHSIVCATRGLLEKLDRREIEGVIAHEMSHIKNYYIRLMLIVTVLAGVVIYITDWFTRSIFWGRRRDEKEGSGPLLILAFILAILSPIIATLIQLAVSRRREYLADASGALLTRNPDGLADALLKISKDKNPLESASNGTAHLFIENPVKGKKISSFVANLFNTHPPVEKRIEILRSM